MNISVTDQYGLKAIFDLAMQPFGEYVKISGVAQRQGIPQKFLELILARLKEGGFVESRRGIDGGYRLLQPADQLSIGEIMRFMAGSKRTIRDREKSEVFTDLWKRVDKAIGTVLDNTSFAEVVQRWREAGSHLVSTTNPPSS